MRDEYYKTEEEFALVEAMRREYQAIIARASFCKLTMPGLGLFGIGLELQWDSTGIESIARCKSRR
jgi:hypothetical protein